MSTNELRSRTSAMSSSRIRPPPATALILVSPPRPADQAPVPCHRGGIGERGHLVNHHPQPRTLVRRLLPKWSKNKIKTFRSIFPEYADKLAKDLPLLGIPRLCPPAAHHIPQ